MDDTDWDRKPDLRAYIMILRRRAVVALVTALMVILAGVLYVVLKSPAYAASATVLVPLNQASTALNPQTIGSQDPSELQRLLADQEAFARGDEVKSTVDAALRRKEPITVSGSTTSDILTFTSTNSDPTYAATIANTYARSYTSAARANQISQYTQQITALQQSISQLKSSAAKLNSSDPQLPPLQQSIGTLTQTIEQTEAASLLVSRSGPTIVTEARPPTAPTSPRLALDLPLAAVIGILMGIAVAFLRERLDDKISSREVAEAISRGRPLLALLPFVESWKKDRRKHLVLLEEPGSPAAEAFRGLRTAVQFLELDRPTRTLAITSPDSGEGKTTTVANLALSFAKAGKRVVVVSCDLRKPTIHEFFAADNRVGLTSVLLNQVTLDAALQPVDPGVGVSLLASGPVPPNPSELLTSAATASILRALADNFDLVLLDCPPVLPVTDATIVARHADGVLLLASARTTSRRALRRALEMLLQVRAEVFGLILNGVPLRSGAQYGYGYGYGYGQYTDAGTAKNGPKSDSSRQSGPSHSNDIDQYELAELETVEDHAPRPRARPSF